MSNKEIIKRLKHNGLDKYGSWAVYGEKAMTDASNHGTVHVRDVGFPDDLTMDELAKKINPQYMFVALNVSKEVADKNMPWHNFHYIGDKPKDKKSKNGNSKDGNILKIITGTNYFGAYMTDIIKDLPERKGVDVLKRVAGPNRTSTDIDALKGSLRKFNMELDITKPKNIIIFGKDAFEVFKMAVQDDLLNVSSVAYVVETDHYSKPHVANDKMYARLIHIEKDKGVKKDKVEHDEKKWNTIDGIKDMPTKDGYKLSWK